MSEDKTRFSLDDIMMPRREPSQRDSPLATIALVALVAAPILMVVAAPAVMNYLSRNYPATHQTIMSYLETK